MNIKICFTHTILNRLSLLLITLFFILACRNSEIVMEKDFSDRSERKIIADEKFVEKTGKKESFGYVDWWPVSTEKDQNREYTASTSTVKEIPFPVKIILTPTPSTK